MPGKSGFYDHTAYAIGAARATGWRSEIDRLTRLSWCALTIESITGNLNSVADLGCADGALVNILHERYRNYYVGVDSFKPFLKIARTINPDVQFIEADLRDLEFRADVVVAIGTTVGHDAPTLMTDIYEFADRAGATTVIATAPTLDSFDPAITAARPPDAPQGWTRTMGPAYVGEAWWCDSQVGGRAVTAQACFDRANTLVQDTPGRRAMVAARLGLRDIVATLAASHPYDEHVRLAQALCDGQTS